MLNAYRAVFASNTPVVNGKFLNAANDLNDQQAWATTRGAGTVKLLTLLDKQSERRVMLQPEYFGFLLDERFVVGYGLGAPQIGRNLPYIAAL